MAARLALLQEGANLSLWRGEAGTLHCLACSTLQDQQPLQACLPEPCPPLPLLLIHSDEQRQCLPLPPHLRRRERTQWLQRQARKQQADSPWLHTRLLGAPGEAADSALVASLPNPDFLKQLADALPLAGIDTPASLLPRLLERLQLPTTGLALLPLDGQLQQFLLQQGQVRFCRHTPLPRQSEALPGFIAAEARRLQHYLGNPQEQDEFPCLLLTPPTSPPDLGQTLSTLGVRCQPLPDPLPEARNAPATLPLALLAQLLHTPTRPTFAHPQLRRRRWQFRLQQALPLLSLLLLLPGVLLPIWHRTEREQLQQETELARQQAAQLDAATPPPIAPELEAKLQTLRGHYPQPAPTPEPVLQALSAVLDAQPEWQLKSLSWRAPDQLALELADPGQEERLLSLAPTLARQGFTLLPRPAAGLSLQWQARP